LDVDAEEGEDARKGVAVSTLEGVAAADGAVDKKLAREQWVTIS
jgi:hypothetical protein